MNEHELELVRIDSLPQVEEFFTAMLPAVQGKVKEMCCVECSVDNRKDAKATRTEIRKFKERINEALKSKEKELLDPWYQVKARAKEVTDVLDNADKELKARIDAVEDEIKREREQEFRWHFEDCCEVEHIDWLTYEQLEIKVGLSDTDKKIKELIYSRVCAIANDMKALISMGDVEAIAEYKHSLNLSAAISIAQARRKAVEKETELMNEMVGKLKADAEHCESVENAVNSAEDDEWSIIPPKQINTNYVPCEMREMAFKVRGTLEQLKSVKKFLIDNNIEIL